MCGTCGCGQGSEMISYTRVEKDHIHAHNHGHHHHHENGHHHHHTERTIVDLEEDILNENKIQAARNRGYFEAKNIRAFNLVSSPGSGKTALLEKSLPVLSESGSYYVIEGDQQTSRDAERVAKSGVPVLQINTGNMCHLDAEMVYNAVKQLNPDNGSTLIIENVGNLVCPALFDLGETTRVVIMSVTEGDDKPIKYPNMFRSSDLCIINKIDLLEYVPFDVDRAMTYARQVNPEMEFIQVSAHTGTGMEQWINWLKSWKPHLTH